LAFYPWGPWHAGKYLDYENRDNHYINIGTNITGCFDYYDPRIQEWHDQNVAAESSSEFPFSPYQMLPIDSTETMGNFHKSDFNSEIPNFRTLNTAHEPVIVCRKALSVLG
jgi:hypothetical protein